LWFSLCLSDKLSRAANRCMPYSVAPPGLVIRLRIETARIETGTHAARWDRPQAPPPISNFVPLTSDFWPSPRLPANLQHAPTISLEFAPLPRPRVDNPRMLGAPALPAYFPPFAIGSSRFALRSYGPITKALKWGVSPIERLERLPATAGKRSSYRTSRAPALGAMPTAFCVGMLFFVALTEGAGPGYTQNPPPRGTQPFRETRPCRHPSPNAFWDAFRKTDHPPTDPLSASRHAQVASHAPPIATSEQGLAREAPNPAAIEACTTVGMDAAACW
jgi:hypothetical protein